MHPALILAAAGAVLLLRKQSTAAKPAPSVKVQTQGQNFADPVAVAAKAAGEFLKGIGLVGNPMPTPTADAIPDAARAAVRAGDPYYSGWNSSAYPLTPTINTSDPWQSGSSYGVSAAAAAGAQANGIGYATTVADDAIPAAPVYDPSTAVDPWLMYGT